MRADDGSGAQSGAGLSEWLSRNPSPGGIARGIDALDEQIGAERDGWE